MRNIQQELARKQEEVAKLQAELEAFDALTPERKVAEWLHEATCHWNHTDGCGWHYESWDRPGSTRQAYLLRAHRMTKIEPDIFKLKAILHAVKESV